MRLKAGKAPFTDFVQIKAIRRSGHRGTSVLNWIINFVLTHVAIFQNPFEAGKKPGGFLDPHTTSKVDRWGKRRMFKSAFEGDDSIYAVSPRLTPTEIDDVQKFWTRCGFNMKLFQRRKVAEFTGWKLGLDNGKPVWSACGPDLLRNLTNCGYTTSQAALQEHKALGKPGPVCAKVAAASCAAFSKELRQVPTISMMFANWAREYGWQDNDVAYLDGLSKNQQHILFDDGEMPKEGLSIREVVLPSELPEEFDTLQMLGLLTTKEQYEKFRLVAGVITPSDPDTSLRELGLGEYAE
jgi:hypothetical protein